MTLPTKKHSVSNVFKSSVLCFTGFVFVASANAQASCSDILVSGVHNTYQSIDKANAQSAYKAALCDEQSNLNQSGTNAGGGISFMGVGINGDYGSKQVSEMKKKYCTNSSADLSDADFHSLVQITIDPNIVNNWRECMQSQGRGLFANVDVNGSDVLFTVIWQGFAGKGSVKITNAPQLSGVTCSHHSLRQNLVLNDQADVTDLCHRVGKRAVTYVVVTEAGSKTLKLAEIPTSPTSSAHLYKPLDSSSPWMNMMSVVVTRKDVGVNANFGVDLVIPPPPIPNYAFNLITLYANHIGPNGQLDNVPQITLAPKHGSWKVGDPVHLEFVLPKQNADPAQGWNLRMCLGTESMCLPSANLLVGAPI